MLRGSPPAPPEPDRSTCARSRSWVHLSDDTHSVDQRLMKSAIQPVAAERLLADRVQLLVGRRSNPVSRSTLGAVEVVADRLGVKPQRLLIVKLEAELLVRMSVSRVAHD